MTKTERRKELEQRLVQCSSASDVFAALAAAEQSGTVALRAKGLSTALHRIAKGTLESRKASLLADERFLELLGVGLLPRRA
eukprot:3265230-Rhodomonas_salina.1